MNSDKKIMLNSILKKCEEERIALNHPYVGSEHLLLSLLSYKNSLSLYLKDYNVTYSSFKQNLISIVGKCKKDNPKNLYTPLLRQILARYALKTKDLKTDDALEENLFLSTLDEGEGIAIRILLNMNVDLDEIYVKLKEYQKINLMQETNKVGVILNNVVDSSSLYGRDEEIEKIILSLTRKKKCNPVLVGPAGVGKTALVEELARRINKGLVPDTLKNKKIYLIDMGTLISGTRYRGEFEEKLNNIIKEIINNKNVIIFIDEIHTMVGAGGADGAINASDILKPYLARGSLKVIGATTTKEYNETFLKDKALLRRFEVINVKELSNEEMEHLMKKIKKEYESFHNIRIPTTLLKKVVELSNCYIKNIANPDKSIDLLDTSCARAKVLGKRSLDESDILNAIYFKTSNKLLKNNPLFINNIKNKASKYLEPDRINELINVLKQNSDKPKSILLNNNQLSKDLINAVDSEKIITIDFEKEFIDIEKNESINLTNSKFFFLVDNPFSIIKFVNVSNKNETLIKLIEKINTDGYLEYFGGEKIYFNSAILLAETIPEENYDIGFSKTIRSVTLPKSFTDSFMIDLRINTKSEILN